MGTSTELINCFNKVLFEKGMSLSILTVLSENSRAISFTKNVDILNTCSLKTRFVMQNT